MRFFHRVDNLVISRKLGAELVMSCTSALAFDCPLTSHRIVTDSAVIKAWEAKEHHLAALLEVVGQELWLQANCYKLNHEEVIDNMPVICILVTGCAVEPNIRDLGFYHIIGSNLAWEILDAYIGTIRSEGEPP